MSSDGKPLLHTRRNAYTEANRKCRDTLCVILFTVFWIGMVIIFSIGLKQGNPRRLIYPSDSSGHLCNKSYPNVFYPHPQSDLIDSHATKSEQSEEGKTNKNTQLIAEKFLTTMKRNASKVHFFKICVANCPKTGEVAGGYKSRIDTKAVFRRCLPSNKSQSNDVEYKYIFGRSSKLLHYFGRYVGDIKQTIQPILSFGGAMAFFGALLWVILLRLIPGIIVWLSIFLAFTFMISITAICGYNAGIVDQKNFSKYAAMFDANAEKSTELFFKVGFGIFVVLDIIFLLVFIFLCSRIKMSIRIIEEASKGIKRVAFLYFLPILPGALYFCLLLYFIVSSAYIGSCDSITMKDINTATGVEKIVHKKPKELMWYLFAYNLFGVLWTQQLVEAITICTVAGAICRYYWTEKKDQLGWPIWGSLYNVFRYHLGSLAFGSCILAFVQFLRILLEFIDKKTSGMKNGFAKVVFCCCRVCLWCLHKCLKFLNQSGYIIIAMKGTSFCNAISDSFHLLLSNIGRVAAVSLISSYVLFMGKLFVSAACTIAMYTYISMDEKKYNVSSPYPPVIVTALFAYSMCYSYLAIFDISIDTILLSVCEDERINKSTGTYYASPELRQYLDNCGDNSNAYPSKDTSQAV